MILGICTEGCGISGVAPDLSHPTPTLTLGKVATLSLIHLHFYCEVAVDSDIYPIWVGVERFWGMVGGLNTLKQALTRVFTSY